MDYRTVGKWNTCRCARVELEMAGEIPVFVSRRQFETDGYGDVELEIVALVRLEL